jgi:hypothetical protein
MQGCCGGLVIDLRAKRSVFMAVRWFGSAQITFRSANDPTSTETTRSSKTATVSCIFVPRDTVTNKQGLPKNAMAAGFAAART